MAAEEPGGRVEAEPLDRAVGGHVAREASPGGAAVARGGEERQEPLADDLVEERLLGLAASVARAAPALESVAPRITSTASTSGTYASAGGRRTGSSGRWGPRSGVRRRRDGRRVRIALT